MGTGRIRKRIAIKTMDKLVVDELEFKKNKCSDNARYITIILEKITFHLWHDKHYHDRHQLGDNDGKRDGIDPETVEALVRKALGHMLIYGSTIRGFKFIHHKASGESPVKVVLQEDTPNGMLNVVIETHFMEINEYEITIKTAMKVDDFRIANGQYAIEFEGDLSILKRYDNGRPIKICEF